MNKMLSQMIRGRLLTLPHHRRATELIGHRFSSMLAPSSNKIDLPMQLKGRTGSKTELVLDRAKPNEAEEMFEFLAQHYFTAPPYKQINFCRDEDADSFRPAWRKEDLIKKLASPNSIKVVTEVCNIMISKADINTMGLTDGEITYGSYVDACCFPMFGGFLNWERNVTGHTLSKNGIVIEMFDWLSLFMKFKYECLPQRDSERFTRDNVTGTDVWTTLYQLKKGFCHVSPMPYVLTYARFQDSDFLSPFLYTPYNLLIPIPEVTLGGISSVWRPFDGYVWMALLISLAATMLLSLTSWYNSRNKVTESKREKVKLDLHWLFLFGLLMSKAGFSAPESFKMRLSGGAWCIAALILTNFYSSVLTSLITTSSPVPIVNSVEELANNNDIDMVIVKGYGASGSISGGAENPLFKKLDKKLKSSPSAICPNQSECYRQVVSKKSTAFLHDAPNLYALVSEDYRKTGRCNVAFAKEPYGMMYTGWAISKNYVQFENYQRGMLRMMETGLVYHWRALYLPKPVQCMVDPTSRQAMLADIANPTFVDLKGLVSAFSCLLFGIIIALVAFLREWIQK